MSESGSTGESDGSTWGDHARVAARGDEGPSDCVRGGGGPELLRRSCGPLYDALEGDPLPRPMYPDGTCGGRRSGWLVSRRSTGADVRVSIATRQPGSSWRPPWSAVTPCSQPTESSLPGPVGCTASTSAATTFDGSHPLASDTPDRYVV